MKRRIVFALTGVLILASQVISFADIGVKVNGSEVPFSKTDNYGVPFVDENNRTLVPFRKTLEFAGATVNWLGDSSMAVAEKDGIKVEVPIGQKHIFVNGEKEVIDTQAIIKEGRTYLPIRAVLEALEYEIGWDQATQMVVAETDGYVAEEVVITEEKVVPREEVIEGKIYNKEEWDVEITDITLLTESPYKMYTKIYPQNNSKGIAVIVGKLPIKNPGTMFFIVDKKVVDSTGGYYNSDDGYMGYNLEDGYDFSDFDQIGFNWGTTEMIVFDNPFK